MTVTPTEDRMTSDVTPHTATHLLPACWMVSWMPGIPLSHRKAMTSMLIAEQTALGERDVEVLTKFAAQIGISLSTLEQTLADAPDPVHLVLVPADSLPRPQCGGSGQSVKRISDATSHACLRMDAAYRARAAEPELHDTQTIPEGDEPDHADHDAGFAASDQADADERSRAEEAEADQTVQAEADAHDDEDRDLCARENCGECRPESLPVAEQKFLPGDWVDITLQHARVMGVGATDEHSVLLVGHENMPEIVRITLTDDILVTVRAKAKVPGYYGPPAHDEPEYPAPGSPSP